MAGDRLPYEIIRKEAANLFEEIFVKSSKDNQNLIFTSCLYLSSELLSKNLEPATFLSCTGLQGFTEDDVIAMAELIQQKSDWPPVMPFNFISFFSSFLTPQPSHSALQPVYQLIVTSQFDIAFKQFKPSVMAVAAMLIFTTIEDPQQLDKFKSEVTNDDHFVHQQEMIRRCQRMLEPLYHWIADREGSSFAAQPKLPMEIEMTCCSTWAANIQVKNPAPEHNLGNDDVSVAIDASMLKDVDAVLNNSKLGWGDALLAQMFREIPYMESC